MTRLLHVGSAVVDYVYRIDALPALGTEKTAASYSRVAGGGFNLMVAAARTGMEVVFGGQHGTGPSGDFLRAAFAAEGIATLNVPSPSSDTGNSVVIVTDDAERTFVSWPGAEGWMSADELAQIVPAAGDWAFASGYTLTYPGSREALAGWIEQLLEKTPLVFDPTPVVGEIPAPILARVLARTTWLSCNSSEAAAIAGPGDTPDVARRLIEQFCPRAAGVVIRAGKDGCFVTLRDGTSRSIPGFAVTAIDTNGAGDTHIGAFISALARGENPFAAARYANAAAAISVTRYGGSSAPTDGEIKRFLSRADDAATTARNHNEKAGA